MATKIQVRRGTAAEWTSSIVLSSGELGFETDTGKFKLGDGTTTWGSLSYFQSANQIAESLQSTDDLPEGVQHLYFTLERVAAALTSGADSNITFTYNAGSNTIDVNVPTVQGIQGVQGQAIQGVQGITGIQGRVGFQGVQGQAIQGVQGVQGVQGTQGIQGAQGTQGTQGLQHHCHNPKILALIQR